MISRFDCDVIGNMDEYIGCKLQRDWVNNSVKFTQPVMIQSFKDEFETQENKNYATPAEPGSTLRRVQNGAVMEISKQKKFRSGTGKLLHMMRWSRPDILNAVRELSKHMKEANFVHYKAMHRVMEYVMRTPKRGLKLAPKGTWDGSKDYEFVVKGYADSTYASDPDTRLSIGGRSVFLNDAPVSVKSSKQTTMTL